MIETGTVELKERLRARAPAEGLEWLEEKISAQDPAVVAVAFPAVGRRLGRGPLDPDRSPDDVHAPTVDDAGRTLLLASLGCGAAEEVADLYRHGDAAEKRGVLRALSYLEVGEAGMPVVEDALRANDTRLIAAAMGPYAVERLSDEALAQAVLKCVFVGVPIAPIEGLEGRATPEMSRMLAGYAHERIAAGRDITPEVWPLIGKHPPREELEAMERELDHPVEARRRAAEKALAERLAERRAALGNQVEES